MLLSLVLVRNNGEQPRYARPAIARTRATFRFVRVPFMCNILPERLTAKKQTFVSQKG